MRTRFHEPAPAQGETTETAPPPIPKRFRINQSDLDKHGYTEGCPQCGHITRYGKARQGGTHSNVCRERILKAIDESEAGKTRLAAYEERTTWTMPERLEYDDKHKAVPAAHEAQPAPASSSRAEVSEGRRQVLGGAPAIGDADADAPGNVRPGDAAALARRQVTFAEGVRGQRPPDEIGNRHEGPVRDFVTL